MERVLIFSLIISVSFCKLNANTNFQVENLRCEYMINPLGIDVLSPHLSWYMTSKIRGDFQTAYRILVSSSIELLENDKGDIWDSKKTDSNHSIHIVYNGEKLKTNTKYYWKVQIWNKDSVPSRWSKPAYWSMGVLSNEDWQNAKWIAYKNNEVWRKEWKNHKEKELKDNVYNQSSWPWLTGKDSTIFSLYEMKYPKYDPSPLFRKDFSIKKDIRNASLYICGLGYYEAFINGQKVGDHVLDPAWTNFEQRAMYAAYDVTNMIGKGDNAIGVMLGRGQYNPLCNDIWGLYKSAWVDQPKVIVLLIIKYKDDTSYSLVTDDSWKTIGGPIVYDDTRHGEIYDARLEQEGWSRPNFDESNWKNAHELTWSTSLVAQKIPPIRCFNPIKPVKTFYREGNITIYDLGETISGWADIEISGSAGSKVLVEYCETPSDRELVNNLPKSRFDHQIKDKHYAAFYDKGVNVRQQNGYILKGKRNESFRCHFSYKAFRFIRITAQQNVKVINVHGIPVHTDIETTGTFSCSNPLINKLQQNAVRSMKYNFHSIATDCPHREKQGWTADNYMISLSAMYNFNMASFYSKWLIDLAGTQNIDGGLCTVAPSTGYDLAVSTAWPAAITYIPVDIYKFYADKRPMTENYDVMKGFLKSSLIRQVKDKPEIINESLGDWLAPLMERKDYRRNNTMASPEGHTIYGTATHYLSVKRTSEIANILDKHDDADEFHNWAIRIADNFNKEFFDKKKEIYHGDTPTEYRQAANIVPLEYGLVPKEKEKMVLEKIIEDIHSKGNRLSTGFLGTLSMMEYLPRVHSELAYTIATQKNYPGWGYMVDQGADTMWESWDGDDSRNHTPFCLISSYFYKYLAGIQNDVNYPGFKHIIINPTFIEDLEYVDAHHDSMFGRIKSSWKKENGKLTINISIPANTTATVYLPSIPENTTESGISVNNSEQITPVGNENGKTKYKIGSGTYSFVCSVKSRIKN